MLCRFAVQVVFLVGTMAVITILLQGSTMPQLLTFFRETAKTRPEIQGLLVLAKEVEELPDKHLMHLQVRCALGSWSPER